jgi:hypothetical protein
MLVVTLAHIRRGCLVSSRTSFEEEKLSNCFWGLEHNRVASGVCVRSASAPGNFQWRSARCIDWLVWQQIDLEYDKAKRKFD